jgi:hypothetical protein
MPLRGAASSQVETAALTIERTGHIFQAIIFHQIVKGDICPDYLNQPELTAWR